MCRHDRKNTNRQCCKYVINTFFNNPCQHFSILRVIIPFSSIGCNIKARRTRHLSGHHLPKVLRYSHYHRYVCFVMYLLSSSIFSLRKVDISPMRLEFEQFYHGIISIRCIKIALRLFCVRFRITTPPLIVTLRLSGPSAIAFNTIS